MVPRLGGDRRDGRGRCFKSLFAYVLGDPDRADRLARIGWAEAINCALSGNIRRAWLEMALVWEARAALKRAAGIPLTGRDNARPVLHLTLSWAPDEMPDRNVMMTAALEVIALLGLAEHQAIVASHTDTAHPHVHIVANTVHPVTGRTQTLYRSKQALSDWALAWEQRHGGVRIEARARDRETRATMADLLEANGRALSQAHPTAGTHPEPGRNLESLGSAGIEPNQSGPTRPIGFLRRAFLRAVRALADFASQRPTLPRVTALPHPIDLDSAADSPDRHKPQPRKSVLTALRINGP